MTLSIHKPLYSYCHYLFKLGVEKKRIVTSAAIDAMTHNYPMLYLYPSSYEKLIEKSKSDEKTLKKLGWLEPIFNRPFIIWYKVDGSIQLVPVDVHTHKMDKLKSLSNQIPFAFKYAKSHQQLGAKLCIVESPVDAIVLQDMGLLAIGTGGAFVHESHIRHLATLTEFEFIFVGVKENVSAADSFSKRLGAIGRDSYVLLVDTWGDLFNTQDIELKIDEEKQISEEFLLDRIIEKRRKDGYSINDEIISVGQALSPNIRSRFIEYAEKKNHVVYRKEQYANACQLFADLLKAELPIHECAQTVFKRYGVKITLNI
jgi:hypothetical protein